MSANRTTEQEKILVVSPDFDGCIANDNYLVSTDKNRAITANKPLLDHILSAIKEGDYARVVLMVGSLRQSKELDDANNSKKKVIEHKAYYTPSCFPVYQEICDYIQTQTTVPCELDEFLLADIAGNKPDSDSFKHACLGTPTATYEHAKTTFTEVIDDDERTFYLLDQEKILLLYAQMHRPASKYANAKIDFYFYDDIPHTVLSHLRNTYNHATLSLLLPRNTALHLHHYNGTKVIKYPIETALTSLGAIDHTYQNNLKRLAKISSGQPSIATRPDEHKMAFELLTCRTLDFIEKHHYLAALLEKLKQACDQPSDPIMPCIASLQTLTETLRPLKSEQTSEGVDSLSKLSISVIMDNIIRMALALYTYKIKMTSKDGDNIANTARCKELMTDFIAHVVTKNQMQQPATSSTSLSFFNAPSAVHAPVNDQLNTFAQALNAFIEPSIAPEVKRGHG